LFTLLRGPTENNFINFSNLKNQNQITTKTVITKSLSNHFKLVIWTIWDFLIAIWFWKSKSCPYVLWNYNNCKLRRYSTYFGGWVGVWSVVHISEQRSMFGV